MRARSLVQGGSTFSPCSLVWERKDCIPCIARRKKCVAVLSFFCLVSLVTVGSQRKCTPPLLHWYVVVLAWVRELSWLVPARGTLFGRSFPRSVFGSARECALC